MDGLIPIAIRCGIPEEQTYSMTYAELLGTIEILQEKEEQDCRFFDILMGKICAVYAAAHGVESCPADHTIMPSKEEMKYRKIMPEDMMDRAFDDLAKASTSQGGDGSG
jgi:hypothetical protein